MLPYMYAANKCNYSRWLPVYLLDMLKLTDGIKQEFNAGKFVAHLGEGRFNGIPTDMAVEKTIVKESKGKGGIIGITHSGTCSLGHHKANFMRICKSIFRKVRRERVSC